MPVTRGHRVNVYAEQSPEMDFPNINSREIIDISCGLLTAKLHKERFICPGINRECIEYQGLFITPKSFYLLAEKGSLKDWKNAIRINGKKIRRFIDSGELDFYNHNELCTGRCKSRMGHKTSTLPGDNTLSMSSSSKSLLNFSPTSLMGKSSSRASEIADSLNSSLDSSMTDSFGEPKDIKPSMDQLNHMMLLNLKPGERNGGSGVGGVGEVASGSASESSLHPIQLARINAGLKQDDGEDLMFWRAIVQLGLIDEFFREIKAKLDVLKVSMIKDYVPIDDARKASKIVNELGMKSKLDMKLCAHKFEFDRQRQKLEKEMEQLKKKVNEYEHKKEVLKQKSDCYEALMTKKLRLDDGSEEPTQFTIEESSTGRVVVVNGQVQPEIRSNTPSPAPVPIPTATIAAASIKHDSTKKEKLIISYKSLLKLKPKKLESPSPALDEADVSGEEEMEEGVGAPPEVAMEMVGGKDSPLLNDQLPTPSHSLSLSQDSRTPSQTPSPAPSASQETSATSHEGSIEPESSELSSQASSSAGIQT